MSTDAAARLTPGNRHDGTGTQVSHSNTNISVQFSSNSTFGNQGACNLTILEKFSSNTHISDKKLYGINATLVISQSVLYTKKA